MIQSMPFPADLARLNADELRGLLIESQARIDKLTYELAYYKRQRYGVKAEHLSVEQAQLFEETTAADLAAISEELEKLSFPPVREKDRPICKPSTYSPSQKQWQANRPSTTNPAFKNAFNDPVLLA